MPKPKYIELARVFNEQSEENNQRQQKSNTKRLPWNNKNLPKETFWATMHSIMPSVQRKTHYFSVTSENANFNLQETAADFEGERLEVDNSYFFKSCRRYMESNLYVIQLYKILDETPNKLEDHEIRTMILQEGEEFLEPIVIAIDLDSNIFGSKAIIGVCSKQRAGSSTDVIQNILKLCERSEFIDETIKLEALPKDIDTSRIPPDQIAGIELSFATPQRDNIRNISAESNTVLVDIASLIAERYGDIKVKIIIQRKAHGDFLKNGADFVRDHLEGINRGKVKYSGEAHKMQTMDLIGCQESDELEINHDNRSSIDVNVMEATMLRRFLSKVRAYHN